MDDIENIMVKIRNGKFYLVDNRWFWVFKKFEKFGKCDIIGVLFGEIDLKKFIIMNFGILVCMRRFGDFVGNIWDLWILLERFEIWEFC